MQTRDRGVEMAAAFCREINGGLLQAIRETLEPMARGGDSQRDVLSSEAIVEHAEPLRQTAGAAVHGRAEAEIEFVDALETMSDGVTQP